MKNIADMKTATIYRSIRKTDNQWTASLEILPGKHLNSEGETPASALLALAEQWVRHETLAR